MCIKDHYSLGNQRTEIWGGLNIKNISEKLGRDIILFSAGNVFLIPQFLREGEL